MHMLFRVGFAALAVVLGISFAVKSFFSGSYFSAASFTAAGGLAAWGALLGFDGREMPIWIAGGALFTGLGICAAFFETPGLDMEKGALQLDITADLANASMPTFGPTKLSPKEVEIARITLIQCATQQEFDLMQSAIAAHKAIHLGPTATLADESMQTLAGSNREERCLSGFRILYKAAPSMFVMTVKNHELWLKKHGFFED